MDAQQANDLEKSYDEVPYESLPYPETHPANTAMVARLFGLTPPDFRNARVLELGCSGGGNLAPLALAYPASRFLGIDFSQEAINEANALKNFAQLSNVEFVRQDILGFDIAKHRESFDYIISHGVFSWIPPAVSARILEICGACLKPNGLAVISYNALPGWNAVRSIRDMLLHHAAGFETPQEKIRQSRAFLDLLAENAATTGGYRTSILEERNLLKHLGDFYFFHDHLSGENTQFYFRDFMRMAQQQQLAYVGEAYLPNMFFDYQPPEVVKMLRTLHDIVEQEQYMDYVTNRRFRSTILCKSARKLNRNLNCSQVLDFFLTANMAPKDNADPAKPITFVRPGNIVSGPSQFVCANLYDSALFLELIACGQKPVAAEELFARTQKRLNLPDAQPLRDALAKGALSLVTRGFITLHADSPACLVRFNERPVVSPIARYQATKAGAKQATNLLGKGIATGPVDQHLSVAFRRQPIRTASRSRRSRICSVEGRYSTAMASA
jgi:methyltransferase-like protein/trans-aconitate methyltransferase